MARNGLMPTQNRPFPAAEIWMNLLEPKVCTHTAP